MCEVLQDLVNFHLPFLHFLGKVSVLEQRVEGVVLEVDLGGGTGGLPLLLGSACALRDSGLSTMTMLS